MMSFLILSNCDTTSERLLVFQNSTGSYLSSSNGKAIYIRAVPYNPDVHYIY